MKTPIGEVVGTEHPQFLAAYGSSTEITCPAVSLSGELSSKNPVMPRLVLISLLVVIGSFSPPNRRNPYLVVSHPRRR